MDIQSFSRLFSKQYFLLEDEVFALEKYISFSEDNFSTYSPEICKLMISICSEVAVCIKELLRISNIESTDDKMRTFHKIINREFLMLKKEEVAFKNTDIVVNPWLKWSNKNPPIWWSVYNGLKHDRGGLFTVNKIIQLPETDTYKLANLGNLLNALAALYTINYYCLANYLEDNEKTVANYLHSFSSKKCELVRWEYCIMGFMGQSWFEYDQLKKLQIIAKSNLENEAQVTT